MVGTDYYKIGYTSRHISKRLSEIQVGCPTELKVVSTHKSSIPSVVEGVLHNRLAIHCTSGEWFQLSAEQVAGFNAMCEKIEESVRSLRDAGNPFV